MLTMTIRRNSACITIDLLLAVIVDDAIKNRSDSDFYRIPIVVQFAWVTLMVVGCLMIPETPRFLIRKGKSEKATQSLSKLRRLPTDHPALIEELQEIVTNHGYRPTKSSVTHLYNNYWREASGLSWNRLLVKAVTHQRDYWRP